MEQIYTIIDWNGHNIRLDYFGAYKYTEDGQPDEKANARQEAQAQWTAIDDIREGHIEEYHDNDDYDYDGLPYMVISNAVYERCWDSHTHETYSRKVGERRWRIDFIDYPDVEDKGMLHIWDRDGWVDTVPDEDVRYEWMKLAYRITQII